MKGLKGKITEEEEELAFDLRDGAFLMKEFFSDHCTKMKFSIKDFLKPNLKKTEDLIKPHLLKKSLMVNFVFCEVG